MFKSISSYVCLLALVFATSYAVAEEVRAPAGFTAYCAKHYTPICGDGSISFDTNVSQTKLDDLLFVNSHINRHMVYQRDEITYGKAEFWSNAPKWIGDCEDSVIKKIQYLYIAGWHPSQLRIATAFFYDNKPPEALVALGYQAANHAVLIATFEGKEYVLDSATPHVLEVDEFRELYGAKILTIQSSNGKWVSYK